MRYFYPALLASVIVSPQAALAQDGAASGSYIGIEAGYAFGSDLELATDATRSDPGLIFLTDGYDIGVVAGHDFGSFRIEAEFAHRDIGLDGSQAPQNDPVGQGAIFVSEGDLVHQRLMLNGYGEIGAADGFQGFVGAGIGAAWSDLYVRNLPFDIPIFDDSDSSLAWQLMAGLRLPVAERFEASLKYRYLQVENAGFNDFFGNQLDDDHATSSVSLGIAYRF